MPIGFGSGRGGSRKKGGIYGSGKGYRRRGRDLKFGINRPQNCICPACGNIQPHQPGLPCFKMKCPQCNSAMVRQFVVPDDVTKTDKTGFNQKPKADKENR
jgi:hypothetical protein